MAKVKKKRKHKPQSPPLSALDKFLYVMVAVIHLALMACAAIVFVWVIPSAIAYSDNSVVAFSNTAGGFAAFPLLFFLMMSGLFIAAVGIQDRQPLFGNKNFKSKNDIPIRTVYPLFSKKAWKRMRQKQCLLLKIAVSVYVVLFLICSAFIPFGMCPRYTLDRGNIIKKYNVFNSLTDSRDIESAEKLVINIRKSGVGKGNYSYSYEIQITLIFADEEYGFEPGNFEKLNRQEALEYIVYLKSLFDGKHEITNIGRLNSLIEDKNYTAEEEKLIYDLFEYGGTQN